MIRSGFLAAVAVLIVSIPLAADSSNAKLEVVFGPQVFALPSQGQTSVTKTVNFSLDPPAEAPFLLSLASVGRNTVILNGVEVYGPGKASPFTQYVDLSVSSNTLQVELGGEGAQVTVTIVGYRYTLAREYENLPVAPLGGSNSAMPSTGSTVDGRTQAGAAPSNRPVVRPDDVDWREKGVVTDVKDEGRCHASWAFSATGAIEGRWDILGNPLVSFSEQQLIDCADVDFACWNGGTPLRGIKYVVRAGGIEPESDYPYKARESWCKASEAKYVGHISSWVRTQGEAGLAAAIEKQPVSVVLNGNWFRKYKAGVVDPCQNDYAPPEFVSALVVGYVSTGTPCWIVKNSLGTSWGENGYFRLVRGKDACGIADFAVYPK